MHIVWDWNGTLLDDLDEVVAAVNTTLTDLGVSPITVSTYGALYTRPVRHFYDRLLGRPVSDPEWERIDEVFHDAYRSAQPSLASDALDALEAVAAAGHTQSLLSMLWHDDLVPMVRRFGLERYFTRVDGLNGARGAEKGPFLVQHLNVLGHPRRVTVVGDALDDAAAARHAGVDCVLYDRGVFPADAVAAAGFPTASTLLDAIGVAGVS